MTKINNYRACTQLAELDGLIKAVEIEVFKFKESSGDAKAFDLLVNILEVLTHLDQFRRLNPRRLNAIYLSGLAQSLYEEAKSVNADSLSFELDHMANWLKNHRLSFC